MGDNGPAEMPSWCCSVAGGYLDNRCLLLLGMKNEQQDARWSKESQKENSTALGEGLRARDQR
jgi:hypothetical protein